MVDDASFFLAPSSTSIADFYSSRGHHSPASSRSSKRDEKEDEEEVKKVSDANVSGSYLILTLMREHLCIKFK